MRKHHLGSGIGLNLGKEGIEREIKRLKGKMSKKRNTTELLIEKDNYIKIRTSEVNA